LEPKPKIEDVLLQALNETFAAPWEREYPVCPERDWRVDLALPTLKIAVEVDGRMHSKAAVHVRDCEKQNYLSADGWRVFRYPASRVNTRKRRLRIVEQLQRAVYGVRDPDLDTCVLQGE